MLPVTNPDAADQQPTGAGGVMGGSSNGLSIQARILIVARDDALIGPLAEGLDRLGWRTITARGPYAATTALADLRVEAVIVDAGDIEDPAGLVQRLKTAIHPRRLPVIGVGMPSAQSA